MSTLLHLDASASPGTSVSRTLTAEFAAAWQAAHPVSAVIHRDVGLHAPAPLDRAVLEALWKMPDEPLTDAQREAREASNRLVEEFLSADAFVLGVPMYNFSVPAGFKAWLDHVVRMGRTVVRGPRGSEPLIRGRKALVIATRAGDFSKGGARDGWDFVGPYLEKVLAYVGLEPEIIPVVNAPGHAAGDSHIEVARERLGYVLARDFGVGLGFRGADATVAEGDPRPEIPVAAASDALSHAILPAGRGSRDGALQPGFPARLQTPRETPTQPQRPTPAARGGIR